MQILVEIYRRTRHTSGGSCNVEPSTAQHFVKPNLAVSQDIISSGAVLLGTPPPPIPAPSQQSLSSAEGTYVN